MKKALLIFILLFSQFSFAQSDCPTAITVCGNSGISYTPSGPGNILEELDPNGCLNDDENFSVWYTFTIATAGTLTFTIDPNVFADDYDFAVYGPNQPCALVFGPPLRCNYSGADGPTGLNLIATDPNGGGGGSPGQFSSAMNVLPGETYYLIIDNFSNSPDGFSLNWGGTATLASPFNDPSLITNPFIAPGLPNANPNDPNEVIVCANPAIFDFSSLTSGIINGNTNFTVSYHLNTNDLLTGDNPIITPITVNTTDTYYYSISYTDPTNPSNPINKCKQTGEFKFKDGSIVATDATLTECNNNNTGTAVFDLTTANVILDPTFTKKYYPTMYDLNAGTNEITNPYQYVSGGGSIFVLVTTPFGCTDIAEITLSFFPVVKVTEATLRSCFIESNPSTGLFNLTIANVTTQAGTTKKYYPSSADAVNETNEIQNPDAYIAPSGVVFIRVSNANGCYTVAKVTLVVIPPVYSTVLVDKVICIEDKTTLDAGPGFDEYEWSTGATTQVATDISVGTYWVKLRTGECTSTQHVKVYATEQPVVSNIDISNNTITVNVVGGTPAYQYSLDETSWQDSNVFTNLSRGDYTIYVKDAYDCTPIEVEIVVPNLINVITPNGDGINDAINYSALSNKKNLILSVFDRYGTKIFQADQSNNYTWDGTIAGKKIPTGTYWYSVTWNENNKTSTPIKFSGWVMVKNRE